MGAKLFGAAVKRLEDPDLLTGKGQFTDDIRVEGALHAVFIRSPHPHARFNQIDTAAAIAMEGVRGIFTLADFPKEIQENKLLLQQRAGSKITFPDVRKSFSKIKFPNFAIKQNPISINN